MTESGYALSAQAADFYETTFVPALFGRWARRLVGAADLGPGLRVLDVACGTGVVARAAAEAVGPAGTVVGVDLNEAMLAVARRVAPALDWRVADAAGLPFGDASFDRVLCQAALMFFDDRVAALREMGRVAGPAGRIALQVPGRLSHSAGYAALTAVVERHAGARAGDLLSGYFSVGRPEQLRALCAAAGLRVEAVRSWVDATRLGSLETFLDVELLPIADEVSDEVRARVVGESRTALSRYVRADGSVAAPIEVQLIRATAGP